MEFSEKLKLVRKKLFLSQQALAEELGVTFTTLNRWENNKYQPGYKAQKTFYEFCLKNNIEIQ